MKPHPPSFQLPYTLQVLDRPIGRISMHLRHAPHSPRRGLNQARNAFGFKLFRTIPSPSASQYCPYGQCRLIDYTTGRAGPNIGMRPRRRRRLQTVFFAFPPKGGATHAGVLRGLFEIAGAACNAWRINSASSAGCARDSRLTGGGRCERTGSRNSGGRSAIPSSPPRPTA